MEVKVLDAPLHEDHKLRLQEIEVLEAILKRHIFRLMKILRRHQIEVVIASLFQNWSQRRKS